MVRIYILVDPRNNTPFYVGASRASIYYLTIRHMSDLYFTKKPLPDDIVRLRKNILFEIRKAKMEVTILTLELCNKEEANKRERFYYDRLTELGYQLFNDKTKFHYHADRKKKPQQKKECYSAEIE